MDVATLRQNWRNALKAADDRYHSLREALNYGIKNNADPEMLRRWRVTLWGEDESRWLG